LGGSKTLRGFVSNRFSAANSWLVNFEARHRFQSFSLLNQRFEIIAVPFIDAGSIFYSIDDFHTNKIKICYGTGTGFIWNQATVLRIDLGFSKEGTGFYVEFNHIF